MPYKARIYAKAFNPPKAEDEVFWFDDLYKLDAAVRATWSGIGGAYISGNEIWTSADPTTCVGEIERILAVPLNPDHF